MSGAEISLLAVTVGFVGLVVWVYWPSRRNRLESYGDIPRKNAEEDNTDGGGRQ